MHQGSLGASAPFFVAQRTDTGAEPAQHPRMKSQLQADNRHMTPGASADDQAQLHASRAHAPGEPGLGSALGGERIVFGGVNWHIKGSGPPVQLSPLELVPSATDGMVLIGTLIFRRYTLDFMSFQFPVIQRFSSAPRLCLVREGKLLRRNMRRELITDEELNAKIRYEGVEDLATVKRMDLEADSEMSLIRRDKSRAAA